MNGWSDLVARAERADAASERRVRALRDRLAMPDVNFPTEWHAAAVAAMLDDLVAGMVDRFRAKMAEAGEDVLPAAFPIPQASEDPRLVALALRRADEHRLGRLLERGRAERPGRPPPDAAIASLELALLVAESRRRDRLGEPRLAAADLDAETMRALVSRIAAAARERLIEAGSGASAADRAITAAAAALIADHDEREGVAAAAMRLARQIGSDDGAIVAALANARPALAAALLALRTGLSHRAALEALLQPERSTVLLRGAGMARDGFATALLLLAPAHGLDDEGLVALVDVGTTIDESVAGEALSLLRRDSACARPVAEDLVG